MSAPTSLNARPDPRARERRIAVALFVATGLSIWLAYFLWWGNFDHGLWERGLDSALFTGALLLILLAHEFGHYFVARRHGFRLTLPLFIPMPYLMGTLGAIIAIKERPPHRIGLAEMGLAGPLAGFFAIVLVLLGRFMVGEISLAGVQSDLSSPLLFYMVEWATGQSVVVSSTATPLAMAAWLGCLITAFNLLPFRQLDGGHIVMACWPDHANAVSSGVLFLLVIGGFYWVGWWIWAVVLLLTVSKRRIELRTNRVEGVSSRLRVVVIIAILIITLVFHPVPFQQLPSALGFF